MYIEGDVPVVTTTNGNNGGWGGFMNGDGIWAIILFAMIFGYGRNGFGGFGGGYGGSGIGENYVLATDFATIERKLDGVNNGLCDGFYAQNTNMLNGFANVQQTLCQGFSGVNNTITTNGYETRNAITDIGYRLQDCCCKTQSSIKDLAYSNSKGLCDLQNAMFLNTRDIIENQNANYRAIHEELVANKLEAKNDRIAELQDKLYKADLRASQAQQSNYITDTIINKLSPCPNPAYIVPNPNCCYNYNVTGVGYGTANNCCC